MLSFSYQTNNLLLYIIAVLGRDENGQLTYQLNNYKLNNEAITLLLLRNIINNRKSMKVNSV